MSDAATISGQRHVIDLKSASYPESLKELPDAPKRLYVVGDPEVLRPGLAIIGARRATPYGLGCARRFGLMAAQKGIIIISGGARGCDAQAHEAALEAGAGTVVFLGGGCDRLYPKQNIGLFQRVVDAHGALVSEWPWDFDPRPFAFRARNRLIAGLAEAVLIVEAGLPSGTFSTADNALDGGKEVLVVPGCITSSSSHGSNRLIAQGAVPIVDDESFEDVLFTVFGALKYDVRAAQDGGELERGDIVEALLAAPMTLDDLYDLASGLYGPAEARGRMMSQLAQAEARGIVARYPNGSWGPVVSAETRSATVG